MTAEKTYYPKGRQPEEWILVDASDKVLGHIASQIAQILLGKNKPSYTPGVDMGNHVVVINVHQLRISQNRLEDKRYYRHSGYPGGIKSINLRDQLKKHPERVIQSAVWGMLPHNKLGRQLLKKVKAYGGGTHPHEAQKPTPAA